MLRNKNNYCDTFITNKFLYKNLRDSINILEFLH